MYTSPSETTFDMPSNINTSCPELETPSLEGHPSSCDAEYSHPNTMFNAPRSPCKQTDDAQSQ